MLERIDKAFESIRAFTGNASHELRTPISLLRAEIDVALFRPRDAGEYHLTLMRLNEEAVRMTIWLRICCLWRAPMVAPSHEPGAD